MGLIKTNLRTIKIFKLAKCTLRFAVSLSENISQGCLQENTESRDNHQKTETITKLPMSQDIYLFVASFTPASLRVCSDHQSYLQLSAVSMICVRGLCIKAIPGVSPFIQILKTRLKQISTCTLTGEKPCRLTAAENLSFGVYMTPSPVLL